MSALDAYGPLSFAGNNVYTPTIAQQSELDPCTKKCFARLDGSGSILVTGGMGGIGQLAGIWMACRAASSHVWLLGRKGRSRSTSGTTLNAHQGCISMASANVAAQSDLEGINKLMIDITAPAMTGILHAAAVLSDAILARQTAAGFRLVMAPKYSGARCVLSASRALPLQRVINFSSLTALLGNQGQANYAAANGTLDDISQEAFSTGLQSTSILWGPWALGLALQDANTLRRLQKGGVGVISSE